MLVGIMPSVEEAGRVLQSSLAQGYSMSQTIPGQRLHAVMEHGWHVRSTNGSQSRMEWTDTEHGWTLSHTYAHSHRRGTWEGSSTLQNTAEAQLWQPDITAAATLLHWCDRQTWTTEDNKNRLKHWWTQLWMEQHYGQLNSSKHVCEPAIQS